MWRNSLQKAAVRTIFDRKFLIYSLPQKNAETQKVSLSEDILLWAIFGFRTENVFPGVSTFLPLIYVLRVEQNCFFFDWLVGEFLNRINFS